MNPLFVDLVFSPAAEVCDDRTLVELAKYLTKNNLEIKEVNTTNVIAESRDFTVVIELYREVFRVRRIVPKASSKVSAGCSMAVAAPTR